MLDEVLGEVSRYHSSLPPQQFVLTVEVDTDGQSGIKETVISKSRQSVSVNRLSCRLK